MVSVDPRFLANPPRRRQRAWVEHRYRGGGAPPVKLFYYSSILLLFPPPLESWRRGTHLQVGVGGRDGIVRYQEERKIPRKILGNQSFNKPYSVLWVHNLLGRDWHSASVDFSHGEKGRKRWEECFSSVIYVKPCPHATGDGGPWVTYDSSLFTGNLGETLTL